MWRPQRISRRLLKHNEYNHDNSKMIFLDKITSGARIRLGDRHVRKGSTAQAPAIMP